MVRVNKGYKVKVHIAVDRITSSLTTVANVLDYAALPLSWRDDSLPNGYRARKSTQDDQEGIRSRRQATAKRARFAPGDFPESNPELRRLLMRLACE